MTIVHFLDGIECVHDKSNTSIEACNTTWRNVLIDQLLACGHSEIGSVFHIEGLDGVVDHVVRALLCFLRFGRAVHFGEIKS
jgi:hypothetical protein